MAFRTGRKAVTSAGTRVQLSTDFVFCQEVAVTAHEDNTGTIVIGDSNVVASAATRRGLALGAGQTEYLRGINLQSIWVDSTQNNDAVTYAATSEF